MTQKPVEAKIQEPDQIPEQIALHDQTEPRSTDPS